MGPKVVLLCLPDPIPNPAVSQGMGEIRSRPAQSGFSCEENLDALAWRNLWYYPVKKNESGLSRSGSAWSCTLWC